VVVTQQGGSIADTAAITISSGSPTLVGLLVAPDSSTVATGGSQQFAVQGVWTNGGSGTPAVTWQATGGSISSTGLYTAGSTTGSYQVIATQSGGSLADTATIFVASSAPAMTSLDIKPGDVTLQTGVMTEFWSEATWSDGSKTHPAMDWSATGGGTMYSDGHFQAGTMSGSWKVIGKLRSGNKADTVSVTITGAQVTRIQLNPSSASVATGGVQQFATTATWSDGVSRPVAVTYSATGGNIDVTGRYTAGQVAGTFAVIAVCGCGIADTSTINVSSGGTSGAVLTSLQINPSQATVAPGGSLQFGVSAQWSDGTTVVPPVSWSTNGGSINSSGLYAAPSAAGTYRVIVAHSGGTLKDTAAVSVQTVTVPQGVWVQEDFSSYSTTGQLLQYPSNIWSGSGEDVNIGKISLDTDAPPVGGKSMRYDFPDRSADSRLCNDYTIGRNIKFPNAVPEVWVDQWVKFDNNFQTLVPACAGVSSNGYKFIFGRCHGGSCGRYELKVGNQTGLVQTAYAPGLNAPSAWQVIPISTSRLPYSNVADGKWHRWRQHLKAAPAGGIQVWFDNQLVYDSWSDPNQSGAAVDATSIYGLALGRNMNQGPTQPQSLWWGRVQVFLSDPGW